ncbi:glucose-6-phosphate dehydrogenase [Pseudidiomarina terrestris]|uniref:Glucose-6-phosphate 1-dehydrogenase n=1 Tax=Pseudidiomarina terrestris TaxID=2820060 RepID=A0AAW7QYQ3_9GAMM|nr:MULTISPECIES: glucose-6-phosphate dehydrogenase [unclassified Pseudidiomarina]MDN7124164.1 glucose-6-phosphate dehydrogenase [Pseudidiomarina sp. 1APP75-32.1]MDN7127231.1 glucose-6-phosphate dehydrogenase [Pseudidiomarina sp. 1APR75-33.1]MDN7128421.1 glucose-6-phosphate dehydrogenase [Pseudidiomarina sp. 1APR75-15]MDN7135331.1 glucose-6-phosphate dehydrogenase [Pseudidiomarina sp. 1ASP75-5]
MTTAAECCDLILFGSLGDLARRKLLPALYQLEKAELLHAESRIIGVARDAMSAEDFRERVQQSLKEFVTKEQIDNEVWQRFAKKLHYCGLDLADLEAYDDLAQLVTPNQRAPICYFATPPSLFPVICDGLASIKLNQAPTRVVLEKPLGHDLASCCKINQHVARYFDESQVYRIDHYLGKETVLNLLALRFANSIFSDQWNHNTIDHIQITAAEQVGVEGRWGYYDDAGQLRDMVQNHLLQVLSLIAMEPPTRLDAESIREEKLKVLKSLRPITQANVNEDTVRGQYAAGFVGENRVPGYMEEEGAVGKSSTETFVGLKVHIDNWRWSGVPFYLRTGKRMPQKRTEVVITFKPQPHNIFHETLNQLPPNRLIIRLQPDEGVEIQMMNKVPGLGKRMQLKPTTLDLSFYETFENKRIADAYERLLLEAIEGNQYLFVHREEVEHAWRWIDGIRSAWTQLEKAPKPYAAGTWGPVASVTLMAQDGREWDDES